MQTNHRKEALARTVRLLTRQGTQVTFRGSTPFVMANKLTGEVVRLNLPEIPDDAPPHLIEALQGYVDHECGHIFYTPFQNVPDRAVFPERGVFANIFEDIRLEKLLPRDLPGTKDNLERMYINWLPLIVQPSLDEVMARGDKATIVSALLMPAMRALGGQKVFIELMDDKGYWKHLEELMKRLPGFGAQITAMETYDDVLACVDALEKALTPPPPPPAPPQPEPQPQPDEPEEDDSDDTGEGEGHGDGAGTDDEEGDEDDDQCSGENDEAGDDESDGANDEDDTGSPDQPDADGEDEAGGDGDDADDGAGSDQDGGDDGEADDDEGDGKPKSNNGEGDAVDPDGDEESTKGGDNGKRNKTMVEALGLLDPTLRRVLYMYKRRMMSISEIGKTLNMSEEDVGRNLREARRGLAKIMRS